MLYIVPNELRDALYKVVDDTIEIAPKLKDHREELYQTALSCYNDTGNIPSIKVKKPLV